MRLILLLALCCGLAFVGCRKRKTGAAPEPAPAVPEAPAAPAGQAPPTTASAPVSAPVSAPTSAAEVEASIEFSDLNDVIASFEAFHKRMPTAEDLKKAYYGGTRPLPIPPGHKLVIDPKSKKAKLVRGN